MTAKELAERLDGRQYMNEITQEEERLAMDSGLVVIFGYSDDNMELRGAIFDEVGCFDGGSFLVHPDGTVTDAEQGSDGMRIDAVWCGESGAAWEYETPIPHETFDIYEDDELFCVGIVFRLEDVLEKEKGESNG